MSDKSDIPLLADYVMRQNWALRETTMIQLKEILERHIKGEKLTEQEITIVTAEKREKGSDQRKYDITGRGTAIIPISGVIAKYSRMVNGISQPRGTAIEELREQFNTALADRKVSRIFLHIESPGGSVDGLADFAQSVYEGSFAKPVLAYIDDLGASAAYWIASQANEVLVNQTGEVGSIGVYTLYVDTSERVKQFGLRYIIIRSGPNKGVGATGIEITEENIQAIQESIDATYEIFLETILKGRAAVGLDAESLRQLADGRVYVGALAVEHKLADGVMTFDQALEKFETEPPALRTESTIVAAASAEENNNVVQNKEPDMAKEKEDAAATDPNQIRSEERQRVQGITEALKGEQFNELRTKAISDGMTVEAAKAAAFDVAEKAHAEALVTIQGKLDEANKKLDAIANGGDDKLNAQESTDEQPKAGAAGDDGKAETYQARVDELVAAKKTKAEAFKQAAHELPESHKAWKEAQQKTDSKK